MKCPRTGSKLKQVKVGGISIDISTECGGAFFDYREIESFDEKHEKRGEVLADHLTQFSGVLLNEADRINCPKCPEVVMRRRYYSPQRILEIDDCPSCGGIWLDAGELETLREIFLSDSERAVLREKLIEDVERHPDIVAHREEHEQFVRRMDNFSEILWRIIGVRRRNH